MFFLWKIRSCFAIASLLCLLPFGALAEQPTIQATLTFAPKVPPPISRSTQARVVVDFEANEFTGELTHGEQYTYWGFNQSVPGPMIRVRQNDTVEFHLKNHKDNRFPHNIDLHAVNGPGGGAAVNLVIPGKKSIFSFKVLNPGLYIYHCASPVPNIPAHIANGMYGMILVEPEQGLPKVDREFYVLQSEFFTQPSTQPDLLELSMEKGLAEHPDYVVFNGKDGALTGDGALKAVAGETVRMFFGNIGPNSISSFHIIGEIFDTVYIEGSLKGAVNHNVQTTVVPSAGSTIVEFIVDVPGDYLLVDHSIFRVAKGAVGFLSVTGKEKPDIFKSIQK
ncbi:copper-containing nitrite reductase [Candidatus Nitronereus thalassa]|uniref:Copper-containing nitrite reductase n=1 Tax=Candidatus Nitronereus thalassa TaxID=3020898 RepID=A0ABU3K5W9_9BACT|nr:copper-containing nitrite reductase [Candidatus Nitronereus thalassa]MDT7041790.1 copper-containing nitrite reductase [Candidatus Nitronereus thalassa]